MQNESGHNVDLYIPRKWYVQFIMKCELLIRCRSSWTNRIIAAKDHASVQFNVGRVNANGQYTGENDTIALAGYIRAKGEGDEAVNTLMEKIDRK